MCGCVVVCLPDYSATVKAVSAPSERLARQWRSLQQAQALAAGPWVQHPLSAPLGQAHPRPPAATGPGADWPTPWRLRGAPAGTAASCAVQVRVRGWVQERLPGAVAAAAAAVPGAGLGPAVPPGPRAVPAAAPAKQHIGGIWPSRAPWRARTARVRAFGGHGSCQARPRRGPAPQAALGWQPRSQ